MVNPDKVTWAANLLEGRAELPHLEAPISHFIGQNPTPERLTEAALALAQPHILMPYINAALGESSGTTFAESPAFIYRAEDLDGKQLESIYALTIAQGEQWDAGFHVWLKGQHFTDDPHTHQKAFGSAVLLGEFADEVLVKSATTEGTRMTEWRHDQPEPLGEVTLRSLKRRVFKAGQYHTMPHTRIHSAQIRPQQITGTLVVRWACDSSNYDYTSRPQALCAPRMEPIDKFDILRRLRKALGET